MERFADTPFWRLYALATGTGDVCSKAREIFGPERLALALATLAPEGTELKIKPKEAAHALNIPKTTAFNRILEIEEKGITSNKSV